MYFLDWPFDYLVLGRAGRSPTFQDPGTSVDGLIGLTGTRVPAGLIEQVFSLKQGVQ